jgi:CelD/BcsL family acetyltransferase involved in cellulose biosynthesis
VDVDHLVFNDAGERQREATLLVERVTDISVLESLAPEWDALDAMLPLRTPFTSALWNLLWWKHFREQAAFVRDDLFVHLIRNGHGKLVAVAPQMLTQRPAFGPLRMRTVHYFGADRNVTELRGIVCKRGYESLAVRALHQHMLTCAGQWDQLQWCGIAERDWKESTLGQGGAMLRAGSLPDYWLPLPSTSWEKFKATRPRNIRESLRKCYNSLRRDGHQYEFQVVSSREEVADALNCFFDLHAARARSNLPVHHSDVFAGSRSRAFMTEYARLMAERDQLRIFQLKVAGTVVATRIGFTLGAQLYLYYSGYLPEWGRYSVMTTLLAESMKWALAERFDIINLSTGTDVSKTRWRPSVTHFCWGVQRSPTRYGQLLSGAYDQVWNLYHGSWYGKRMLAALRRES